MNVILGAFVDEVSDFFADLLLLALGPFGLGDGDGDGDGCVFTAAFSSRFAWNNRRTYSWSVAR